MKPPLVDVLLALGVVLFVAGCTESPQAEHTVDYYRGHDDARRARVKTCTNDPGATGRSADCINALEADRLESIGSFRDLAPMQLPDPHGQRQ